MPQLGETVTEGTITKWFKQVGDAGRRGRGAVRGLDRQGRLRGAVARGRLPGRDPGARGRDRRRRAPCWRSSATRRRGAAPRPRPRRPPSRSRAADRRARAGRTRRRLRRRRPAAAPAPAPAAAAGRRSRAPRRPSRRRQGAVAGRAPADHRARPRPGADHRHRRRRSHHPQRRARGRRVEPGRAGPSPAPAPSPPRRRAARRLPTAPRPAPRVRAERDTVDAVHQHPPAHRRAHGAVEGRPRRTRITAIEVDYEAVERVRARRARHVEGRRGLQPHLPAVHLPGGRRRAREFPHLNATVGDERARSCTTTSTSASRSTSTSRACWSRSSTTPTTKRLRAIAREINDLADPGPVEEAVGPTTSPAARSRSPTRARSARCSRADHQPAAGRDPLDRRREAASRSWSSVPDGSEAIAIHSVGHTWP